MSMRPLVANDLWTIMKIMGELDVLDGIKEFVNSKTLPSSENLTSDETAQLGMEFLLPLLNKALVNSPKIKDDFNAFLADLSGQKKEEVESLSFKDYLELIKAFFTHPDLKDLLNQLSTVL